MIKIKKRRVLEMRKALFKRINKLINKKSSQVQLADGNNNTQIQISSNLTDKVKSVVYNDVVKIDIHYLPNAKRMKQIKNGGCIDAYTYENVNCKKGEHVLFNLGFSCKLPEGYDANLIPCRSSTMKNYGLLGIPGYIDNSYCGTDDIWYASCIATKDIFIPAGTRAFQWRLIKTQPSISFDEKDHLDSNNRGGFGSTGK